MHALLISFFYFPRNVVVYAHITLLKISFIYIYMYIITLFIWQHCSTYTIPGVRY